MKEPVNINFKIRYLININNVKAVASPGLMISDEFYINNNPTLVFICSDISREFCQIFWQWHMPHPPLNTPMCESAVVILSLGK